MAENSVNQSIAESLAGSSIMLDGVSNEMGRVNSKTLRDSSKEIAARLPDNIQGISRKSFVDLSNDVDRLRRLAFRGLGTFSNRTIIDAGEIDSKFVARAINGELMNIGAPTARPISRRDAAVIHRLKPFRLQVGTGAVPNPPSQTFSTWLGGVQDRDRRVITNALKDGFFNGRTKSQIVATIRSSTDVSIRNANLITMTGLTHITTQTRLATFQANEDIVTHYQYVSILDDKTTPICNRLNGNTYRVNSESAPKPPQHANCRSMISPVVKSWREMQLDEKNIPATRRRRINGTEAQLRGAEYLSTLGETSIYTLFGRTKGQAFLAGQLSPKDLVNGSGITRDIGQLKRNGFILQEDAVSFSGNTELPLLEFADSAESFFNSVEGRHSIADLFRYKGNQDIRGGFTYYKNVGLKQSTPEVDINQLVQLERDYYPELLTIERNRLATDVKAGNISQQTANRITQLSRTLESDLDPFQEIGAIYSARGLAKKDFGSFLNARYLTNYVGNRADNWAKPGGPLDRDIARYKEANEISSRNDTRTADQINSDYEKALAASERGDASGPTARVINDETPDGYSANADDVFSDELTDAEISDFLDGCDIGEFDGL